MTLPDTLPLRVLELEALVYRAPIEHPVRAAMGTMTSRPAVVVRATAEDGTVGFGEVWCNFPTCGAEHRARLVTTFLAPLVVGARVDRTGRGVRRADPPLPPPDAPGGRAGAARPRPSQGSTSRFGIWRPRQPASPFGALLGGSGDGRLPAYASGINPDQAESQALAAREAGFRAFKLKLGFGRATDLGNLAALRKVLGPEAPIAVDSNQAWRLEEATSMAEALAEHDPLWLEEPIRGSTGPTRSGAGWRRPHRSRSQAVRICAAMKPTTEPSSWARLP